MPYAVGGSGLLVRANPCGVRVSESTAWLCFRSARSEVHTGEYGEYGCYSRSHDLVNGVAATGERPGQVGAGRAGVCTYGGAFGDSARDSAHARAGRG